MPNKLPTILDQSMLSKFQECPQAYYNRYVCDLESPEPALPLVFGIAWHRALEAYYLTYSTDKAIEAFELAWGGLEGDNSRNLENAVKMLKLRETQFANDYITPIQRESIFKLDMGTFTLSGRKDGEATLRHQDGIFVLEFKSTGRKPDYNWLENFRPNNQIYSYILDTKAHFEQVPGAIVEQALAHATRCEFYRGVVEVNDRELILFCDSFRATYEHMANCYEYDFFPMHPSTCGTYKSCTYRELCNRPHVREQIIERELVVNPYTPPGGDNSCKDTIQ